MYEFRIWYQSNPSMNFKGKNKDDVIKQFVNLTSKYGNFKIVKITKLEKTENEKIIEKYDKLPNLNN